MIRLFNYSLSPCGEKVRYALLEKGLPFDEIDVDLAAKSNLEPEFLALNPAGLVPVLSDGAATIVESGVINEYLDDAYPDLPLRPAAPADRAAMRLWTKHVDDILHPAWPPIAWPVLIRPRWLAKRPEDIDALLAAMPNRAKRDRQRSMLLHGTAAPEYTASRAVLDQTLDRMEADLGQTPWLAGQSFSLADIALLPYVFVAGLFGLTESMFTRRPHCEKWYGRAATRPAFGGDIRSLYPGAQLDRVSSAARELIS